MQELTSNDNRSSEQLRVTVEQLMLAAGNQNPDVRLTGSAAPKSGATVKVDAEIENEEDVLREVRAIRLGPFVPPQQKHSTHAPGPAQVPFPGRNKNIPRTRQAQPRSLRPGQHKNFPRAPAGDPRPTPSSPARHSRQPTVVLRRGSQLAFQSPGLLSPPRPESSSSRGLPEGSK